MPSGIGQAPLRRPRANRIIRSRRAGGPGAPLCAPAYPPRARGSRASVVAMATDESIEPVFASTTFEWRKVKITPGAAGKGTARRSRRSFLRLPRADRTRPIRLEVVYRGGAESWWLVKGRGEHQVFPGHAALEDVMARVYSER